MSSSAVTQPGLGRLRGWSRFAWRQLTSMRAALFLLLLLLVAAVPGMGSPRLVISRASSKQAIPRPDRVNRNCVQGGVVDLQGGVLDVVVVGQHLRDGLAAFVAVVPDCHQDVRRQRGEPGGDLPDVEVVDLDDAVDRADVPLDGGDIGVPGCGL